MCTVYVIRLLLTNHVIYNVYHVLPLPIKIMDTNTRFTIIRPERAYLLRDVAKQYYARLRVDKIKECKWINTYHKVCKHNNPVQITHLYQEYKVEMLHSIRNIPSSCSQRIAESNQTLGPSWMRMSGVCCPQPDVHTVLCPKQEPSDLEVLGTGKLVLHNAYKAYR
jgi:hypothetical protein